MDYFAGSELNIGPVYDLLSSPYVRDANRLVVLTTRTVRSLPEVARFLFDLSATKDASVHEISKEAPIQKIESIATNTKTPEVIVAVGGGSAIDASKALSVSYGRRALRDIFYGSARVPEASVDTIAVPTTAGTGAEVSQGAILFDSELNVKKGIRGSVLRPTSAWLDPSLLAHGSETLIGEAAFDCLTHAVETYCAVVSNPATRYQSVSALRTVFDNIETAVTQRERNSLLNLSIAAYFMGNNLAHSRTCLPHRMQYVLGPRTSTSHSRGLMMLYRGWLPLIQQETAFKNLGSELGMTPSELTGTIQGIVNGLIGNERLSHVGVSEDELAALARQVSGDVKVDPSYGGHHTILSILEGAL